MNIKGGPFSTQKPIVPTPAAPKTVAPVSRPHSPQNTQAAHNHDAPSHLPDDFAAVQKRHRALIDQSISLKAQKKAIQDNIDSLLKEAQQKFGVSSIEELRNAFRARHLDDQNAIAALVDAMNKAEDTIASIEKAAAE